MLEPFWEEFYRRDDRAAFTTKPNATLCEFEHLLGKDAEILEAGCGEGQNVLYLAEQGYTNIDAFDLSENGIAKVKRRCAARNLRLNACVVDLTAYAFEKQYDLVMCFGTLHFVPKEKWKRFIAQAKANTRIGGIHIMQVFTDVVPITEDLAPFAVGLAKDGELREQYEDWEILQFLSYVFDDQHDHLPKHQHAANKIVARRIR